MPRRSSGVRNPMAISPTCPRGACHRRRGGGDVGAAAVQDGAAPYPSPWDVWGLQGELHAPGPDLSTAPRRVCSCVLTQSHPGKGRSCTGAGPAPNFPGYGRWRSGPERPLPALAGGSVPGFGSEPADARSHAPSQQSVPVPHGHRAGSGRDALVAPPAPGSGWVEGEQVLGRCRGDGRFLTGLGMGSRALPAAPGRAGPRCATPPLAPQSPFVWVAVAPCQLPTAAGTATPSRQSRCGAGSGPRTSLTAEAGL